MLHPWIESRAGSGLVYRHATLTVPEQLKEYFYTSRHDSHLLSEFMRCGHECLEDVVSTVLRQLVNIGSIVVVQTHGRSGHYNPHLHVIMTDGGINQKSGKWIDLGYFPYEMIHKKWQHHLFRMVKSFFCTDNIKALIDELYNKYSNGLVAHVDKGKVPESWKGLAKYLVKYVVSPPIAVRRIIRYDGETVKYWYKSLP